MPDPFYRRHLPHRAPIGRTIFVTFNLKGALPKPALDRLAAARRQASIEIHNLPSQTSDADRANLQLDHARKLLRISEEFLDRAEDGPRHLADPRCAQIVHDCMLDRANDWYDLFAFVVMPNHVHMLIKHRIDLDKITGGIKKWTARRINPIIRPAASDRLPAVGRLSRADGIPPPAPNPSALESRPTPNSPSPSAPAPRAKSDALWQDESFDHFPRDAAGFNRIIAYIERNPVAAGLCARPQEWPFSSAPMRPAWPLGDAWKKL